MSAVSMGITAATCWVLYRSDSDPVFLLLGLLSVGIFLYRLVRYREGTIFLPSCAGRQLPPPAPPRTSMGSDALVGLDQDTWTVMAKYNLALMTLFGLVTVWVQQAPPANPESILLVENGVLALLFGSIQTYAWISS